MAIDTARTKVEDPEQIKTCPNVLVSYGSESRDVQYFAYMGARPASTGTVEPEMYS